MKAQELIVRCFYNDDGESIQDLLYSSFAAFLKRSLENLRPHRIILYDRQDEWSLISTTKHATGMFCCTLRRRRRLCT